MKHEVALFHTGKGCFTLLMIAGMILEFNILSWTESIIVGQLVLSTLVKNHRFDFFYKRHSQPHVAGIFPFSTQQATQTQ